MDNVNSILLGDCLELFATIPDSSVDMVVTSPPYNVGIDYGEGREKDAREIKDYIYFAADVMSQVSRGLKSGGRCCVEIGGSGRNFPLSWTWQDAAYKAGLGLFSEIVIEHRKTNPTAWGSYLKPDNVYTIPNFHMLYVFYKDTATKRGDGTNLIKEEFVEWTRGRWKINFSRDKNYPHPAPYPVSLPTRCIKLFGHIGDLVLDPFGGVGTTAVACIQNSRDFILFEINAEYVDLAKKRIVNTNPPLFLEEDKDLTD